MKLISVHIDGFGKLRNFSYSFSDGLNCIEEENGYGKTTLAAFIKAMLYGIKPQNSVGRDIGKNVRLHYAPWDNGAFGGSLDIETSRGNYRIYRKFGKKPSDDSFSLQDLSTGLDSSDFSSDIGTELFGADAETYEKSTFVPQYDVDISMSGDIGAKLIGLLQSSDDMSGFEDACKLLDKYIKQFRLLKGDGGLIYDCQAALDTCIIDTERCEASLAEAVRKRADLEALRLEIFNRKNESEATQKKLDEENALTIERKEYGFYLDKLREAETAERKLEKYHSLFPQEIPTEAEINETEKLLSEAEIATAESNVGLSPSEAAELENLERRFSGSVPEPDELNKLADDSAKLKELDERLATLTLPDIPAVPDNSNHNRSKTLLLIGAPGIFAGAVAAIIGLAATLTPLFITGAVAVLLFSVCVAVSVLLLKASKRETAVYYESLYSYNSKKKEYESNLSLVKQTRTALEAELGRYYPGVPGGIDAVIDRLHKDSERYSTLLKAKQNCAEQEKNRRAAAEKQYRVIEAFFSRYGIEALDGYRKALSQLKFNLTALENARSNYDELKKSAENYKAQKSIGDEPQRATDILPLKQKLEDVNRKINELHQREGTEEQKIASLEKSGEELPVLRDRAHELRELISLYEQKRSAAETAKKLLTKAKEKLSSRYLNDMQHSFCDSFNRLCGSGAPDIIIDANLGISFRETGSKRTSEWYSRGLQEVISICLRLALTDALFGNEKPFMILDDPFNDLDDKKLENALKIIRELANDRQIIYLTCHSSRTA